MYGQNEMLSTPDKHEADSKSAVLRRLGGVLLLVIANLLAACGSGGGDAPAPPSTSSTSSGGTVSSGSSATLYWDPAIATGISGYRVYYGSAPGTYEQIPGQGVDVGNATSYTVTGLGSGTRYYFTVTSYDGSTESTYSNEVFKDMP